MWIKIRDRLINTDKVLSISVLLLITRDVEEYFLYVRSAYDEERDLYFLCEEKKEDGEAILKEIELKLAR